MDEKRRLEAEPEGQEKQGEAQEEKRQLEAAPEGQEKQGGIL